MTPTGAPPGPPPAGHAGARQLRASTLSATEQSDGSFLWLESIEIPFQGKARNLVFHVVGEDYCLVDDFVWPDVSPPIRKAEIEGDIIRYFSFDEIQVREATSLQVGVGDK